MSFFAQATVPNKLVNRPAFYAGIFSAALLTVAATAQLFMFEDFPAVLAGYPLPGGYATSTLFAALLVSVEVLAVPSLLMMRLSPLMRSVSLMCGWSSCIVWLTFGSIFILQGGIANSGLLGATVVLSTGWPAVLFGVVLLVGLLSAGSPVPGVVHRVRSCL